MRVTTSDIDRIAWSLATMLNEWFSGPKPSHDVDRLESMIASRMRRIVGANDKDARIAELDAQLTECRRAHNSTLALFVAERERAEKAEVLLREAHSKFATCGDWKACKELGEKIAAALQTK